MSNWIASLESHDTAGTLYVNTIGVKMDPTIVDELTADHLADACYTWFGAEYRACLSEILTFDSITVRRQPEPSSEEGVHAVGLAGTVVPATIVPRELAVILSWKTSHPGRRGRGHIALPLAGITDPFSGPNVYRTAAGYFSTIIPAFLDKLDEGHDYTGEEAGAGHLSHIVYSRVDNAGYDVTARLVRSTPRWVQRRQTAP